MKAAARLTANAIPVLSGPKKIVNILRTASGLALTDFCTGWIEECAECLDRDPLNSPHDIAANKECMKKAMAAYEKCNSEENRQECKDRYPFDAGTQTVGMGLFMVCHHPVDGGRHAGEPQWKIRDELGRGPPQEGFHCPSGNPAYSCTTRCFDTRPDPETGRFPVPLERMNCSS